MSIHSFSFKEILEATNDFAKERILGRGGYGTVYKGFVGKDVFKDGTTTVAVKRLHQTCVEGVQNFEREVTMLSKLRDPHIVSLLGYCDYPRTTYHRELILVYEFMPGGTIADRLYNRSRNNKLPPLLWEERIKICIGSAEGLDFLHTGRGIIHRDVKSANILLNDKLESKVSDFGLSKLTPPDKSYYSTSKQRGTLVYLDPALRKTKKLTTKSDVYSFGVVLLEMLCGRAAVRPDLRLQEQNLVEWAKPFIEIANTPTDNPTATENVIRQIVDASIMNKIKWDCLVVYMKLVKDCLHEKPKERPMMRDVAAQLRRVTEISSDGDHSNYSSNSDSVDSDIAKEVLLLAHLQGSSRTAGSYKVEESIAGSNLEVIDKENFNVDERDGGSGNLQESTNSEYFTAEQGVSNLDPSISNNAPKEPESAEVSTIHHNVLDTVDEGGHQYENNVDVITLSSLPQYLGPQTPWPTNAVSGMSVGNHGKNTYMELKRDKKYRYLIYKIDEKKKVVVVEKTGDRADTHSQFVASLPTDDCRFAIYDLDFLHSDASRKIKILLIHWCPSLSKAPAKVLYALSLGGLKKDLEGIHKEVQANTLADVSLPHLMSRF